MRRLRTGRALFRLITVAYLRRHPGRVALLLLAVSLGVGAIVASGSLIASALTAVERVWHAGDDLADLRVANGFAGVPESLLEEVRAVEGVAAAGARLGTRLPVRTPAGDAELHAVAFDFLGDPGLHREALAAGEVEVHDETDFLVRTDALVLERGFAAAHGLGLRSELEAQLPSGRRTLYVAGLVDAGPAASLFRGSLALMDLPTAQLLLGREGLVDAIDVRVAAGAGHAAVRARLESRVGGRATVSAAGERGGELRSLLANIRLVLGVPGAIAIVVGALVVYHAVAVAVSQRRPQLDVVRALGASRRALFALYSLEGLAVGGAGAALGTGIGLGLARLAGGVVTGSIAAIYRPLAGPAFSVSWLHVAIGAAVGVAVTWFAFVGPARATLRLAAALPVSTPRRERWRRARRALWLGLALALLGAGLGAVQHLGPRGEALGTLAVSGDALVLLGLGLALPVALLALSPRVGAWLRGARRVRLRLAWQGLVADPGRSATVLTSVMVGAAYVMITVGAVTSLRDAVLRWIDRAQTADLVVAAPGSVGLFPSAPPLDRAVGPLLADHPDVARSESVRVLAQPYADRWVAVVARDPAALGESAPVERIDGDLARARAALRHGDGVVVSRHFREQFGRGVGDAVELRTPTGPASFRIEAVVTDYSGTDLGSVFVSPETLRSRWRDPWVNGFHLWLQPGTDAGAARQRVAQALDGRCHCSVSTRAEFRAHAAGLVDGLFAMAYALEVLAALVLVVAVVSFFAVALAERRGEIATLASLGATRRQLLGSFLYEAALIGALGGALGCAVGALLALRMVETTMRIGGGFDLDFTLPASTVVLTLAGAVVLCVLASLGPLWRLTRSTRGVAAPGEAW